MSKPEKSKRLWHSFTLGTAERNAMIERILDEMELGLAGRKSSLKMLPAYVWPPTGDEQGVYLAIDFGGTNLRILMVTLKGQGEISEPKICSYTISPAAISGTKDDLCDFIVDKTINFMQAQGIDIAAQNEIGLTFSFPMKQRSITSGVLINWTKGFTTSGMVGQDVAALIREAFGKKGFPQIKIVMANDTIGTLLRGLYSDSNCAVGVILGTGTNAAYIEKVSRIKKGKGLFTKTGTMLINMEWGGFKFLPRTRYDKMLDRKSSNPGEQFLEKMVSARYLGELASLIINDFIEAGRFSSAMQVIESDNFFTTEELSQIAGDKVSSLPVTRKILIEKKIDRSSQKDRRLVKKITKIVMNRSAGLAATMMVAVIRKNDCCNFRNHSIAIDGSLYEKSYGYKEEVRRVLKVLLGRKAKKITPFVCKDGSGVGVAIATAIVSKS